MFNFARISNFESFQERIIFFINWKNKQCTEHFKRFYIPCLYVAKLNENNSHIKSIFLTKMKCKINVKHVWNVTNVNKCDKTQTNVKFEQKWNAKWHNEIYFNEHYFLFIIKLHKDFDAVVILQLISIFFSLFKIDFYSAL